MLGANFGTFSFHLSNFERILGSRNGFVHGTHCPKSISAYAKLAWPPILVGQARKLVLDCPTSRLLDVI